jgi:hypothetical protein
MCYYPFWKDEANWRNIDLCVNSSMQTFPIIDKINLVAKYMLEEMEDNANCANLIITNSTRKNATVDKLM